MKNVQNESLFFHFHCTWVPLQTQTIREQNLDGLREIICDSISSLFYQLIFYFQILQPTTLFTSYVQHEVEVTRAEHHQLVQNRSFLKGLESSWRIINLKIPLVLLNCHGSSKVRKNILFGNWEWEAF